MKLQEQVENLFLEQLQNWPLAATNYSGLNKIQTKMVHLSGGAEIKVQFNPERIRSSAAKVDVKSIAERACFLCSENRPKEQSGVGFLEDYTILVNPFPIFQKHLTVPLNKHSNQEIKPYFSSMLSLAKSLPDYTIFYNGPKCGASAPDHFHFQAGNKGLLPLEVDFENKEFTHLQKDVEGVNIYNWEAYNRGLISLESSSESALQKVFDLIYDSLLKRSSEALEPMLNILAYSKGEKWVVHIFPRMKHRPSCYFKEGNEQLLISPASVDMGGVFIMPRKEDFDKITDLEIESILNEVCLSEKECAQIISEVSNVI
ncbi:DUF4922 domain-containing protein [Carboxylicivirga sp. N1Y90]|uniref:DUF4922 domain-containing protein n=1 Tax=Carboxylicivirga fragile TaxID=3417571 RepID=UPI003D3303F1|nr:DUF4922 domain-containing protein [Marinilabiliaceae bacterium N1Y90]